MMNLLPWLVGLVLFALFASLLPSRRAAQVNRLPLWLCACLVLVVLLLVLFLGSASLSHLAIQL